MTAIDTATLEDINADVSDAIEHLQAGRVAEAMTVLKAMADAVREALAEQDEG